MIIPRVCAHTSPIHPNGENVAKKSPIYWEKNNFLGRGDERLLLPPPTPPPPAMVGGKSRPSTPPWKTIEGLFATFSPRGGGAFLPCECFFATFSSYGGPFSPYGGLFRYVFPLMSGLFYHAILLFFSMWGSFCYVFLLGGGGFLHYERAFIATFFPLWGAFLLLFLIIGGLFWASPSLRFGYDPI